jgi:transcriptional regulator with XRE-family HTH domain
MSENETTVGERIARYRRRLGIPQKTLAQRIDRSERWLVGVEKGQTDPRLSEIVALARELRVEPAKLTDGAVMVTSKVVERDQATTAGMGTLLVDRDEAELTYAAGIYRLRMRRLLMNAGDTPVTRFLVRISVDRYPDDTERSNPLYREHPLTWDELGFSATCGDDPMTWTVKLDRDAVKELYLRFEDGTGRQFPLYPQQSTWIEYSYTVSALKWGKWFQRAVRWPTRHLAVQLRFPSAVGPVAWGTETSVAGEDLPLPTAISRQEQGEQTVFDWSTDDPPLHTRYRMEWRFRHDDMDE